MKAILQATSAIVTLALASLAHAEISHYSTIKQLYALADGNFALILNADSSSCTSPSSPDYYYIVVGQNGMTQEGAKKIFATASLAFATSKGVWIAFDESTSNCYINRLSVVD